MASGAGRDGRITRALLSVQDKTGLTDLARALRQLGVELWATSGTRRALDEAGLPSRSVEELTGVDAWFGGRVKTLHPAVFGGILAPRTTDGFAELAQHQLRPFDLVVVNFYPFEQHLAAHPDADDREEYVDIGGVALARAAAKNHAGVVVVTDPSDYPRLLSELRSGDGAVRSEARLDLAVEAFARCSRYDAAIAAGLGTSGRARGPFPAELRFGADPLTLRYGENPHQPARVYDAIGPPSFVEPPLPLHLVKGEGLSYNNLLDLDAALSVVEEFDGPSAAVVKHANPCGVAMAASLAGAVEAAIATDPVARYGCVVAVNRPFGAEEAAKLHGVFVDLLLAPELSPGGLDALARRPKLKVVQAPVVRSGSRRWEARTAAGRLLVQETDRRELRPEELRRATGPELGPDDLAALAFAWKVVRHAKSNAIALARGSTTVGVGCGQPTRVKAVELACEVAGERARGAVLASDAFFPFPDGIEVAARAGVRAVMQPGGSMRDAEVIAAAERAGIAMYLTGWRVFRH